MHCLIKRYIHFKVSVLSSEFKSFRCLFIGGLNHKTIDLTERLFVCLFFSCFVLLLAHGRPDTLPLRVDVCCRDVCVAGGWNRLQEGVCALCVPSAWTPVNFLLSGKTLYSLFHWILFLNSTLIQL